MMFGKYEDNKLVVVDTLESLESMKGKGFFVVPNSVIAGQPKEYYDNDFNLKPLQTLVDEKIISLSNKEKVVDNRIVNKTLEELIIEGIEDLPKEQKIVDGKLEYKTIVELYADSVITQDDFLNGYIRPKRNQLLNDVDLIYCNAINLKSMTDAKIKEWSVYKQELKDYTDIATTESDFPAMPK